jgi:uncharacterized protein YndB with AHSA1/START domain
VTRVVEHATFTVARVFGVPPARVFAAWADPGLKAGWFADPGAEHALDFRVGGRELYRSAVHTYDARFSDIVTDERIVLSFEMHEGGKLLSLSVATVVFEAAGEGTRLTYTEQATFLDGADTLRRREGGTRSMLDRLGEELRARPAHG